MGEKGGGEVVLILEVPVASPPPNWFWEAREHGVGDWGRESHSRGKPTKIGFSPPSCGNGVLLFAIFLKVL